MATMNSGLGGAAGYGEGVFSTSTKASGGNDDGSVQVDITSVFGAGGIDFFGTSYTDIYVNSNGNISFGSANTDYETADLSGEGVPTIAPFWADVDITSGGEIYWDLDATAGTVTITWDGVAPYSGSGTNSFQVVLTSTGGGDFDLEFIYEDIQWTDGGGETAEVGYTDGGSNDFELSGSGNATTLAGYETHDFGTGDPTGTSNTTFINGVPANVVDGTAGDDTIDATFTDGDGDSVTTGVDLVYGNAGDDTIDAGTGADTIDGGSGDDTVLWDAGDGADTITGGETGETAGDTLNVTATGSNTKTQLSGDGTGAMGTGTADLAFSEIENFVFDAGTADAFNASADTTGISVDTGGGDDTITGGSGDDTIDAGDGTDTISGGDGGDTISGGAGVDTIYGDTAPAAAVSEDMNWSVEGGDATDLGTGFTQDTGTMDVTVTMVSDGNNSPVLTVETGVGANVETQYVATGETFNANSSGLLFGTGDGATADVTFDFAASTGSGMSDEVESVAFRINDVDSQTGNHQDQFTVTAFDADGNPVAVTLTPAGNDTVSGNTVTALANSNEDPDDAASSVLIEVAGPVSQIVVSYENLDVNTQGIYFTDLQFTTIPDTPTGGGDDVIDGGDGDDVIYGQDGNDTITGGAGADTLYGGDGDDTLNIGAGDVVSGGDGDDVFVLDPTNALGGAGATITIVGDELSETGGDTLDFSGLIGFGDVSYSGAEAGTATLSDGTTITFSNIENVIICFTQGTRIETPYGARAIETLRPGDFVLTRDNGPQPVRWIGARTVEGKGKLAPIRFAKGAFGNDRPLLVSPQHRMLYEGGDATLYFDSPEVMVPAKHLLRGDAIAQVEMDAVTYYHMLFDKHEVVWAEGAPSESFHPGMEGLGAIDPAAREELFSLFPELRADPNIYGQTARTVLKGYEARLLSVA